MKYTNTSSEEYVASAVLNDPEAVIQLLKGEGINSNHFVSHTPKRIWILAQELFENGRIHDIERLEYQPDTKGLHDGREFCIEISRVRVLYVGLQILDQHIKTIRQHRAVRVALEAQTKAAMQIEEGESPEIIAETLRCGSESTMAELESASSWKNSTQCIQGFVDMLNKIHVEKEQAGTPTGIHEIDIVTGGAGAEEVWVIGAPSSCGKTMLMMQIINNFRRVGKGCLVFSLETNSDKIITRFAANELNINSKAILGKAGFSLTQQDLVRMKSFTVGYKKADNVIVCDDFSLTLDSMQSIATQIAESGVEIDIIAVDYLQLIALCNVEGKSREQQVAEVSRTLKRMSKQHQCPVITASQLNEEGKTRESRAIVNDADVFLKITEDGVAVAKNRDAERGMMLPLKMNGAFQRFETDHNPQR